MLCQWLLVLWWFLLQCEQCVLWDLCILLLSCICGSGFLWMTCYMFLELCCVLLIYALIHRSFTFTERLHLQLGISSSHALICASYSCVFCPSSFPKAKHLSKYLCFLQASLSVWNPYTYEQSLEKYLVLLKKDLTMPISWVESSSMLWCLSIIPDKMCRYGRTNSDGWKSNRGDLTQLW